MESVSHNCTVCKRYVSEWIKMTCPSVCHFYCMRCIPQYWKPDLCVCGGPKRELHNELYVSSLHFPSLDDFRTKGK